MKKVTIVLSSLILVLLLAACGGNGEEGGLAEMIGLNEDYADALPVATQLALGCLQLEETDLALDEEQAAGLIPLWQAYQTLSTSDKTAEAEVTAVLNQIQDTMTDEQVTEIAAMALTAEDAAAWMQEAGAAFGRGAMMGGGQDKSGGGFGPGGGLPGMGAGRPGGGIVQEGETDVRATRMAEMGGDAEDMLATFTNRAMTGLLIRTLQIKTGQVDEVDLQAGRMNRMVWDVVSECTGIPADTLQSETAEGATLAEVITAHDGDLALVEAALQEAFTSNLPDVTEQEVEQRVSDWLNSSLSSDPD